GQQPSLLPIMIAVPFTVLGLALLIELGFRRGTTAPNQHGPDPLASHCRPMPADPVAIASELIRCRSVTPDEGGALSYLQELLTRSGFEVHRAIFAEPGTAPVDNLYARIGCARPNLLFAGHTDVVPPGNESAWSHPPFAAEIAENRLYGRGAVDMKGGIACFVAAAL